MLYVHFLIGAVTGGDPMPFAQVGLRWQLDLVIPRDLADAMNPVRQAYFEQALTELKRMAEQINPTAG
jgi:hypothetical protein